MQKNSTVPHLSLEIESQTPARSHGNTREGIHAYQVRNVMLRLSYDVKNKEILHVCLLICDVIPIIKGANTKQNEFS